METGFLQKPKFSVFKTYVHGSHPNRRLERGPGVASLLSPPQLAWCPPRAHCRLRAGHLFQDEPVHLSYHFQAH